MMNQKERKEWIDFIEHTHSGLETLKQTLPIYLDSNILTKCQRELREGVDSLKVEYYNHMDDVQEDES